MSWRLAKGIGNMTGKRYSSVLENGDVKKLLRTNLLGPKSTASSGTIVHSPCTKMR
jgi:peroxiredoxin